MSSTTKTRDELQQELAVLRARVAEFEHAEAERHQASQVLRDSAQRYRTLAESALDMIFVVDAGMRVEYINRHAARFLKGEPEKIIGRPLKELFPPAHFEQMQRNLRGVFESGKPLSANDMFTIDGRNVWLSTQLVPLQDSDGRMQSILGISRDVTEAKRAEEALRTSEATARALMNANVDSAILVTRDGRVVALNDVGAARLGKSPDQIIGTSVWDHMPPELAQSRKEWLDKAWCSGLPARWEDERDGIAFDNNVCPVFDAQGNVTQLAVHATDITERRRAERALRESEERFTLFMNHLPGVAFITDPDGCLVYANEAYGRLVGRRSEELIGLKRDGLFPTEAAACFTEQDQAVRSQKRTLAFDVAIPDAIDPRDWLTSKFPICREGSPTLVGGVSIDITERKRAEEALRQSEVLLKQITDTLEDAVWITDWASKRTVFASPAFEKIWGRPVRDILDKPDDWANTIHPDDRARAWQTFLNLEQEGVYDEKYRIVCPDGSTKWIHDRGFPVRSEDGQVSRVVGIAQDITDQKRAEEALRESEERYKSLVDNIDLGICQVNSDYEIVMSNAAHDRMLHKSACDFLGKKCFAEHEKRDTVCPHCPGAKAMATGCRAEAETEGVRDDGTRISVRIHAFPVQGRDGTLTGFVELIEDITERKRAEKQLRLLSSAVEQSTEGIVVADMDGILGFVNNAVARMHGYEPDEIVGKHLSILHLPEQAPMVEAAIRQGRETGEFSGEIWHARRDRTPFPTQMNGSIFRDEAGTPVGLVGTMQDITERKRAEEALRQSEVKHRRHVESIPAITYTAAIDEASTTNYISPQAVAILGFALDTWAENPDLWRERLHPEDRDRVMCELAACHADGERFKSEYRMLAKDGRVVWFRDEGVIVREDEGRPLYLQGVILDITERKQVEEEKDRLEAQLRHAQKMEAVGQLAGGVAHDFNNVLTVILGNAELLLPMIERGLREESTEAVRSGLEQIKDAGQRAAALTRQLLAFSRKEMTRTEVLDLRRVMNNAEDMLRRLLREDIVLDVSIAPGTSRIRADAIQIEQVIMNLILNARDAMPEGGTLTVTCVNADVDEAQAAAEVGARPGPHVMLAVSDTGIGMSRETMERLFEPFFTTKPRGKGTGLGLATVYGIVRQTGGYTLVESKLGKGSTFRVHFPAVQEAVVESASAATVEQCRGDEVLLVCEDEEPVRRVACQVLRAAGYKILEAENGKRALDAAARHDGKIDLLISDVIMPEMNGKELAVEMGRRYAGMRVMFISGYTDDVLDDQVHRGEGKDFLQKPFNPTTLLRRVRDLLDDG